jgi:hypothetical protein
MSSRGTSPVVSGRGAAPLDPEMMLPPYTPQETTIYLDRSGPTDVHARTDSALTHAVRVVPSGRPQLTEPTQSGWRVVDVGGTEEALVRIMQERMQSRSHRSSSDFRTICLASDEALRR